MSQCEMCTKSSAHICVGNLTIIGPDNALSPGRRQAIIWSNTGILLIGPWGTNFSEILIGIQTFSFKKMHLKMSSAKWRPFCLGLNVLKVMCKRHGSTKNYNITPNKGKYNKTVCLLYGIYCMHCINGLVQHCSIFNALAMEIQQFWTKPSGTPFISSSMLPWYQRHDMETLSKFTGPFWRESIGGVL